jgi:hypothetical protein
MVGVDEGHIGELQLGKRAVARQGLAPPQDGFFVKSNLQGSLGAPVC